MLSRAVVVLLLCVWSRGQHLDADSRADRVELSQGLCRYGNSVECCWGWSQTEWGRCEPHCQHGCKHGQCVGADKCKCHPGYTGKACNQDLNECGMKPRPCKHRCMNTLGSYKCYCTDGYTAQPDGSCRNARTCYHANCQYGCEVMKGAVRCTCPSPGLRLGPDRRSCVDIDECVSGGGVCPRRRKCVNTFGSFVCKCHLGFKLTYINGRYTCIDKDSRSFCSLNPASPKCRCKGGTCADVLRVTVEPHTPRSTRKTPATTTTPTYSSTSSTSSTSSSTSISSTTSTSSSTSSTTSSTSTSISSTTSTSTSSTSTSSTTSIFSTTSSSTIFSTTSASTTSSTLSITSFASQTTTTITPTTAAPSTAHTTTSRPTTTRTPTTSSTVPTTTTTTTSPTATTPLATTGELKTTTPTTAITPTTTNNLTTTTAAVTSVSSTTSLLTTTVNNRIGKEVTHRQRGDVHIPRHPSHNQVWEFDVELGATAEDARDDPEVGVLRCTFDQGLCDWMSDREGDLHWETARSPAGGQYLFVPELKAGQSSIRGARLSVQIVPPWSHSNLCFSFSHWLTGHHVGVLQLFVRRRGGHQRYSPALWSRTGGHGWRHTQVNLTTHSVDKVLLKAERRTGRRGHVAVDDVTLRRGAC